MDAVQNFVGEESSGSDHHALLVAKIVAMVVLLVITVLCGSLPYVMNRCFEWTKKSPEETHSSIPVRCLLFFGGGVLICTTFVHMLPEVIEVVEQLQQCKSLAQTPFALPEMLLCTGFFLMYALEVIMSGFVHRQQQKLSRKESLVSVAFERGRSPRQSILLSAKRETPMKKFQITRRRTTTDTLICRRWWRRDPRHGVWASFWLSPCTSSLRAWPLDWRAP